MKRPLLYDVFSGAGGAAKGYMDAGFRVIGIDNRPQPRYCGDSFIQMDAFEFLERYEQGEFEEADAIHASPPCQRYGTMSNRRGSHPNLYGPTRIALLQTSKPFIIENVIGAPYDYGIVLCGSMFGLKVRRHRNFETSWLILNGLRCNHKAQGRPITVTGHGGGNPRPHSWKGVKSEWPLIMQMPWATPEEVTQSIPPPFTEFIGNQLAAFLRRVVNPRHESRRMKEAT